MKPGEEYDHKAVCANCGNEWGKHRYEDDACPVRQDHRNASGFRFPRKDQPTKTFQRAVEQPA